MCPITFGITKSKISRLILSVRDWMPGRWDLGWPSFSLCGAVGRQAGPRRSVLYRAMPARPPLWCGPGVPPKVRESAPGARPEPLALPRKIKVARCSSRATFRSKQVSGRLRRRRQRWMAALGRLRRTVPLTFGVMYFEVDSGHSAAAAPKSKSKYCPLETGAGE